MSHALFIPKTFTKKRKEKRNQHLSKTLTTNYHPGIRLIQTSTYIQAYKQIMCNYTIRAFICGCWTAGVKLEKLCGHPQQGCELEPQIFILPRRCDDARNHDHHCAREQFWSALPLIGFLGLFHCFPSKKGYERGEVDRRPVELCAGGTLLGW